LKTSKQNVELFKRYNKLSFDDIKLFLPKLNVDRERMYIRQIKDIITNEKTI